LAESRKAAYPGTLVAVTQYPEIQMSEALQSIKSPELVFGIAGPIGVDIDTITQSLRHALGSVNYRSEVIKLTTEMRKFPVDIPASGPTYFDDMISKMNYGNELCRKFRDPAALAGIAIMAIRKARASISFAVNQPVESIAYIIRQLKRPAEVELLRKVYGKQFILVTAYGSMEQRKTMLQDRLRRSLSTTATPGAIAAKADELIERDASEEEDDFGQRLRDTFHLGDVFIDGVSRLEMDNKLQRFVDAFFGRADIAPSKDEYGMYAAKSASLRSSDLSRQVGAAIFTRDGEIIAQGCNEVPKAFGGTYWDLETPDFRDVRIGYDPNQIETREMLRDLFQRLSDDGLLSEKATKLGNPAKIVDEVTRRRRPLEAGDKNGPLVGASIMDVTEYGRVVHAEMSAICDAARLGRSVRGGILYVTTFPCHNCTKHILAAGIKKVFYMEPYPKSRAKALHGNEIDVESESSERVAFMPFMGISPYRYRDIFQKERRKNRAGAAKRWYHDEERPLLDVIYPAYLSLEIFALAPLLGMIEPIEQEAGNDSDDDRDQG
jgi:deoxycytidylate deaminase